MRIAPSTGFVAVTELPLPLDAVEPDPFIADLPARAPVDAPSPVPSMRSLGVLDADSGFVRVLAKRLQAAAREHRVLAAPPARDARVRGLRPDDWVADPCHPEEVSARVEAILRPRTIAAACHAVDPVAIGELEIRPDRFQVSAGGVPLPLTRRRFELVRILAEAEGRVLERDETTGARGATRWRTSTGRSTSSSASCARSSGRPRRGRATSIATSASATGAPEPAAADPARVLAA